MLVTDESLVHCVQNVANNSCFLYINLSGWCVQCLVYLLYIGMAELYILEVQMLLECVCFNNIFSIIYGIVYL